MPPTMDMREDAHDLRKNGIFVHNTTLQVGSEQWLKIDGIAITLDFVEDKTLSFGLRTPTSTELEELEAH